MIAFLRIRWTRLSSGQRAAVAAAGVIVLGMYAIALNGDAAGEDSSSVVVAIDLVAKLLVVLALVYLSARFLRGLASRSLTVSGKRLVDVVEVTHLANNRTLYLVDVANRTILLGATPTQITMLTQIDRGESVPGRPDGRNKTPWAAVLENATIEDQT